VPSLRAAVAHLSKLNDQLRAELAEAKERLSSAWIDHRKQFHAEIDEWKNKACRMSETNTQVAQERDRFRVERDAAMAQLQIQNQSQPVNRAALAELLAAISKCIS